jgi:hypothetical protein
MCVVNEVIEDGGGVSWIAEDLMSGRNGGLPGDDWSSEPLYRRHLARWRAQRAGHDGQNNDSANGPTGKVGQALIARLQETMPDAKPGFGLFGDVCGMIVEDQPDCRCVRSGCGLLQDLHLAIDAQDGRTPSSAQTQPHDVPDSSASCGA